MVIVNILINAHHVFLVRLSIPRKEMEEPELVFSEEANRAIPQMVIKFYESKLTWNEVPEEEQGIRSCKICILAGPCSPLEYT